MKLTKRERILLPAVLIIMLSVLFINFVYLPVNKKVTELSKESLRLKQEVEAAQTRAVELKDMKQKISELTEQLKVNNQDLLGLWDQAELLVSVEDMVSRLSEQSSIDFYDTSSINFLQVGVIGVSFQTNNIDLKKILNNLERGKYFNTQSQYSITKLPEDEKSKYNLMVSMELQFYAMPIDTDFPERYNFMDGKFGKTDMYQ